MKKILLFAFLFAAFSPLWGGIFPKPEMDFEFVYLTEQIPAIVPDGSEQIQCQDSQCIESAPLGNYGLQRLYCSEKDCFSVAYRHTPYQKLIIEFADGVKRESNVFASPAKLHNAVTVTVRDNDLWATPSAAPHKPNGLMRADAWISLLLILLTEALAAFAYLTYTDKSYRIIYYVLAANLITMPLTWYILGNLVQETALLCHRTYQQSSVTGADQRILPPCQRPHARRCFPGKKVVEGGIRPSLPFPQIQSVSLHKSRNQQPGSPGFQKSSPHPGDHWPGQKPGRRPPGFAAVKLFQETVLYCCLFPAVPISVRILHDFSLHSSVKYLCTYPFSPPDC